MSTITYDSVAFNHYRRIAHQTFVAKLHAAGIAGVTIVELNDDPDDGPSVQFKFRRMPDGVGSAVSPGGFVNKLLPDKLGTTAAEQVVDFYKAYDDPNSKLWSREYPSHHG